MIPEKNNELEETKKKETESPDEEIPKNKQLIQMLSFRVVPAYFKEIEKVAEHKSMTVSKLVRSYVKEGMKRDKELNDTGEKNFRVD